MRWFAAAIVVALSVFGLGNSVAKASVFDAIKERGALRVAVAPLSPFVIKGDDGELTGFEIEATTAFAASLGLDVVYVQKPFCELAEAVLSGEADMIASGYSNMPQRRRLLGFSLPYHDTEYYVVVKRSKARAAKTLRGLNRADISIGYQFGGVSGMVAQGEFPGADLKGFSSFTEILDSLERGAIDGAVLFDPYLEMAEEIREHKYRVPHEFALMRTIEAYATDKKSESLREALNAWVIERDLDDYWYELEAKWFSDAYAIQSAPPDHACAAAVPAG
ncbi:MAG: ABC transporter substrate-binding protein [Pseudomonadota bacterium]